MHGGAEMPAIVGLISVIRFLGEVLERLVGHPWSSLVVVVVFAVPGMWCLIFIIAMLWRAWGGMGYEDDKW
jgi:hypothetical protein